MKNKREKQVPDLMGNYLFEWMGVGSVAGIAVQVSSIYGMHDSGCYGMNS
jgi:hypothetical protein